METVGSRRHFRYLDGRGRRITDPAKLERIQSLAIPPAWRDVWISPRATAKLQATGLDAAGRRQYLYHGDYRAAQEEAKFDKLVRFADALPAFRDAMSKHMELEPMSPEWTCVVAVRLINLGWFRVGGDRYTKAHRSMSCSTQRGSGSSATGSSTGLNEYIVEFMGDEFTAKDFRTWGGTLIAAIAFAEHAEVKSENEAMRTVSAVMRAVGERLGNTPAVARASCVSPAVVEHYLDGRTIDDFRPRHLRVVRARETGLNPEEQGLVSFLRSWRIRRARKAA